MRTTEHRVKRETKTRPYDYKERYGASPQEMPSGANDVPTVNAVVAFHFHGDEITTFEVDNEPYVAMRRIVENLGMDWSRQSKRLLEQESKFTCGHMSTTGADGKRYAMLSIPLSKLPLWLASINPNKVPDLEARAKIELYQERSAQALYEFWFKAPSPPVHADLDADSRKVIGGIVKAIVHKEIADALTEALPLLVAQKLAEDPRRAVIDKVSIRQLLEDEKVPPKGRRSLQRKVFNRLMAYCVQNKIDAYQCAHSKTWLFDRPKATWFIRERCAALIADHLAKYNGQGILRLVVPKRGV